MKAKIAGLMVATLLLTGCGGWRDSIANPRNWFGPGREVGAEAEEGATNPLLPRRAALSRRPDEDLSEPVDFVRSLDVEQTPTGAIIRAEGLAARQGAYGVALREEPREADDPQDVLTYSFRVVYPRRPSPVGPEATRIVRDAVTLSRQDLAGIRIIRVIALENARESRRR